MKSYSHCYLVTKSCLILCDPTDCSVPGFPVLHYLQEFAQTHVHWVGDAIQPPHPLSSPSPPALNLSQHQGVLQWVSFCPSGGKSIGASASVLPMNVQVWFPLGLTGWISLQSKGLSRVFPTAQFKRIYSSALSFFMVQLWNLYLTIEKTTALTTCTFVSKVMSLLFNTLSRFVTTFLPRSKCLLILWLQSPSAVILEPKKIKFVTISTFSPSICHEVMGLDAMVLVFWMLILKLPFHTPLSPSSRCFLVPLHFLP